MSFKHTALNIRLTEAFTVVSRATAGFAA